MKILIMLVSCGLLSVHALLAQTNDVTPIVKGAAKADNLTLTVTNENLGGDPAVGAQKKLRVEYTIDNAPAVSVAVEGGVLAIKAPSGKTLTITKAVYGDLPDKIMDVTEKLTSAINNNKLSIEVTNDTLGGDPYIGGTKELRVTYTIGGSLHKMSVAESDTLTLPLYSDGKGDLVIVRADYGAFE